MELTVTESEIILSKKLLTQNGKVDYMMVKSWNKEIKLSRTESRKCERMILDLISYLCMRINKQWQRKASERKGDKWVEILYHCNWRDLWWRQFKKINKLTNG